MSGSVSTSALSTFVVPSSEFEFEIEPEPVPTLTKSITTHQQLKQTIKQSKSK